MRRCRDEAEARPEFEQKALQLAQDGVFEILFQVAILQAQEVEHIRIFQQQRRLGGVLALKLVEFLADQHVGLARDRGAFVEQRTDALPQRANAPAFQLAHLCIEVARERVLDRQQCEKVRPAQMSHQRYDNLLGREHLGELHHAPEVFLFEAAAVVARQLS